MRCLHFNTLKPVCPACRQDNPALLQLETGATFSGDSVQTGVLRCSSDACGQRYPIIRGAPVILPDLQQWLAANLHLLLQEDVDSAAVEAVIGHVVGPEAAFNLARQQQSSYAFGHYGHLFPPDEAAMSDSATRASASGEDPPAGSVRYGLRQTLAALGERRGPVLDMGCAVGGASFELARACHAPVLGIDLNWPLLHIGRNVLDHGLLRYPERVIGNRYRRRERALLPPEAALVDFWICNAGAAPFTDNSFGLAVALNVLDCVPDPQGLLRQMCRITRSGGHMVLSSPLDWAPYATPYPNWIESPEALTHTIANAAHTTGKIVRRALEPQTPTWNVQVNQNSTIQYQTLMLAFAIAERPPAAETAAV